MWLWQMIIREAAGNLEFLSYKRPLKVSGPGLHGSGLGLFAHLMIRACGRTSQSGTLVRHQYDVTPEGTYDGPTPLVRVDTTCCDLADVRILGLSRTVIESVSWILVWTHHGEPAEISLSFFSASSFTNLKIIWIFATWCVPRQHHRTPWAIDRHRSRAVDEWS